MLLLEKRNIAKDFLNQNYLKLIRMKIFNNIREAFEPVTTDIFGGINIMTNYEFNI